MLWQRVARSPVPGIAAALIVVGVVGLATIVPTVVWTHLGQRADERSRWSVAVPEVTGAVVVEWLDLVDVRFLLGGLAVAVALALIRRRPARALAALVLVGGANITTQVLKAVVPRPAFGLDLENSLPSGHTTALVSLALAFALVSPRPVRPLVVLAGSAVATFTGAAVLLERWHRASDVLAAFGVCAAWGGVALLLAHLAERRRPAAPAPGSRRRTGRFAVLSLLGAAGVGVWLVAGGLVAHAEPGNDVVGAVVLSTFGLGGAVLFTLFACGADGLRRLR